MKEVKGMRRFVVSWDEDNKWATLCGGAYCKHISVVTGLEGSDALERFCRDNPDAIVGNCEPEGEFLARSEPRMLADVADIKSSVEGMAHAWAKKDAADHGSAVALAAVLYAIGLTLTTFILRAMGA